MYLITDIEKIYPNWYRPDHELSRHEQQWIWENLPLPDEDEQRLKQISNAKNENVIVSGSVNSTCKPKENYEKNLTKNEAIVNLQRSKADKTSIKDIACWLKHLFGIWQEKPSHWIFIAEHYTPKSINSVINEMQKRKERGSMPLDKPGAYFTSVLRQYHPQRKLPKRKHFIVTNGGQKQEIQKEDKNAF